MFAERGERISQIREYFCDGDNEQFASMLNSSTTFTSSICSGKKPVGEKMLENILATFSGVNRCWLYFGYGTMMVDNSGNWHDNTAGGDILGNGASKTDGNEKLCEAIETLTATNKQQVEQISKLIELLASK